ncbi:uncharacterized protein LOC115234527 [Formica exsecta]|uniref:uncharacterized protein LOC115234527 n=1 Tax=Formica exsecta TaxID=72781 RepID=UPI00114446CA|nr:uncharacterized protein LOC115234527 [Formica exsecta]
MTCTYSEQRDNDLDHNLKPYRRKRLDKENRNLSNLIKIKQRSAKQVSTMCFTIMMQTIKRIFHSAYLCIAIFVFILCIPVYMILGPTNDKHTAINEKKNKRTKKWIYNLADEIKETISPTKNFEDLNTSEMNIDFKIALLAVVPIILALMYCCFFGKLLNSTRDADPAVDRRNVPVHYRNEIRIVFGSGEHLSDDEMETAL